jgi:hypothetical protein
MLLGASTPKTTRSSNLQLRFLTNHWHGNRGQVNVTEQTQRASKGQTDLPYQLQVDQRIFMKSATSLRLDAARKLLFGSLRRTMGMPKYNELPKPELVGEAEDIYCPEVVHEPAQLGRIHACGFGRSVQDEVYKLSAGNQVGSPPERYEMGECLILGGAVLAGRSRHFLRALSESRSLLVEPENYDDATLLNSMQGLRYFGHWLQDDCALYELVRDSPVLISMVRPAWPDVGGYEHAFSQKWHETAFAHVNKLTLWRDIDYSAEKARRIGAMRTQLRNAISPRARGKIIYLSRGKSGEIRDMSNVVDFELTLRKYGIEVVEPGQGIDGMLEAEIVIAIEGSQACHGIYMLAASGSFLILQPPERFYNPLRMWAALLGFNYGIVVGERDSCGYHMNPEEVLRMVDRLQSMPAENLRRY